MNQAQCRDSPELESTETWTGQLPPLSPSSGIQGLTTSDHDQSLRTRASPPLMTSDEVELTDSQSLCESQSRSQVHVCPTQKSWKCSKDTSRSSIEMRTSCAQRARKLVSIDQALTSLRQKLRLARNMERETKQLTRQRFESSKPSLLKRLGDTKNSRASTPKREEDMVLPTVHPATPGMDQVMPLLRHMNPTHFSNVLPIVRRKGSS